MKKRKKVTAGDLLRAVINCGVADAFADLVQKSEKATHEKPCIIGDFDVSSPILFTQSSLSIYLCSVLVEQNNDLMLRIDALEEKINKLTKGSQK